MNPAYVTELLQGLQRVRSTGADKWQACCPAHDDRQASLSIGLTPDGKILLHCFASCSTESILAALHLPASALFPPKDSPASRAPGPTQASLNKADAPVKRKLVTTYAYTDEAGTLLYQALRYEPKGFSQRRPDGQGSWAYNLDGVRRVLYRLPEVQAAAVNRQGVFITEGEKDADNLSKLGLTATTSAMGAGKWLPEYSEALRGAHVVILPDNDAPGRKHAYEVATALLGIAASARILCLPNLPDKGDVSDWLQAGGSAAQLKELARNTPVWTPDTAAAASAEMAPMGDTTLNPPLSLPRKSRKDVALWPDALGEEAYYGLAGDLVRAIEPHTEADPAALLYQFLIAFGNLIGRSAFFPVEASKHHLNLFGVMVGQSSRGRKGTSADHVLRLLHTVDSHWEENCVQSGLSSGEGLLSAVRDPVEKCEPVRKNGKIESYQTVKVDEGVEDKRLLVMEGEFANTLRVFQREGNTLSPLLRQAWDKGNLRVMTKSALMATGAHISICGHITREELRRYLAENEADNGFANRFLWVCVKRSKLLPFGGDLEQVNWTPLLWRLTEACEFAKTVGPMQRAADTNTMWRNVYEHLTQDNDGLFGKVTSRSEAQVLRLSCVYALLDLCDVIQPAHLLAALSAWQYCEDSARYIFGNSLGDPIADAILKALKQAGEAGLFRNDLLNLFNRRINKERMTQALDLLLEQELAVSEKVDTGGVRPAERWQAAQLDAPEMDEDEDE